MQKIPDIEARFSGRPRNLGNLPSLTQAAESAPADFALALKDDVILTQKGKKAPTKRKLKKLARQAEKELRKQEREKIAEILNLRCINPQQVWDAIREAREHNDLAGVSIPARGFDPERLERFVAWARTQGWELTPEGTAVVAPNFEFEKRTWKRVNGVGILIRRPVRARRDDVVTRAITLYDYQQVTVDAVRQAWADGYHAPLVQSVTGSGKSVMIADIANDWLNRSELHRVICMAHTTELIAQLRGHLIRGGMPADRVGILKAGTRPADDVRAVVSTMQSAHRLAAVEGEQLLVIIDEAHHAGSKTYLEQLRTLTPANLLGVSATPLRDTGAGLGDIFDIMIVALEYDEGIARGILVPPRYFIAPLADDVEMKDHLDQIHAMRKKKEAERAAEAVMSRPQILGDILAEFLRLAADRQTIVFCQSVPHAQAVADMFTAANIPAQAVWGDQDPDDRQDAFDAFACGDIQVLTNVNLVREGVDIPSAGCVILACVVGSIIAYIQMVGRGLRADPANGKADCIVIDLGGNFYRHGPVEDYRSDFWSLVKRNTFKTTPVISQGVVERTCLCGHTWKGAPRCPACGAVAASKTWRAENQQAAELELVEAGGTLDPFAALRQEQRVNKNRFTDQEREQLYGQMKTYVTEVKGQRESAAAFLYKDAFGTRPNPKWQTGALELTPEGLAFCEAAAQVKERRDHVRRGAPLPTADAPEPEAGSDAALRINEEHRDMFRHIISVVTARKHSEYMADHVFEEMYGYRPGRDWSRKPLDPTPTAAAKIDGAIKQRIIARGKMRRAELLRKHAQQQAGGTAPSRVRRAPRH